MKAFDNIDNKFGSGHDSTSNKPRTVLHFPRTAPALPPYCPRTAPALPPHCPHTAPRCPALPRTVTHCPAPI